MPEFLVHFKITIPPGTDPMLVAGLYKEEAKAAEPLIASGHFRRVWREPGTRDHWALWAAPDANFVHECYSSFPLWRYNFAVAEVIPLADNANDPGWPGPEPTPVTVATGEPTAHLNDDTPGPERQAQSDRDTGLFEQGVIAGRLREREDFKNSGEPAAHLNDGPRS